MARSQRASMPAHGKTTVYVWDAPTRVFHWLLVSGFIAAWLTFDDNRFLYVHVYAGYTFLGLLLFRLVWGMVGSRYARFRSFAYDWPSVWAYLRGLLTGEAERHLGHNPAGGWAIFLILILGFIVAVAGVGTLGLEEGHGPLGRFEAFGLGELSKEVHEIGAWTLLVVVGVHVAGVIVESLWHRENLVWAMISGHKEGDPGHGISSRYGIIGVAMIMVVVGAGLLFFKGYMTETADAPYVPFKGSALPDNATWRSTCGECHLAFHPSLLPARSWQKIMEGQADHFGDDLALDDATVAEVTTFLVENAAEKHMSEPAWKVDRSIAPNQVPLRITDTMYWKNKHSEIDAELWKSPKVKSKANCKACHLDAEQGTFEDSGMRLPKP